jgi:hypothetical protein
VCSDVLMCAVGVPCIRAPFRLRQHAIRDLRLSSVLVPLFACRECTVEQYHGQLGELCGDA